MLFINIPVSPGSAMPTRDQIAGRAHWNLWQVRQAPFKDLADDTEVVLVESWAGGGRFTWLVRVSKLLKASFISKSDAVRQIGLAIGLSAAEVRRDPYTVRGPDAGFLLAWRPKPVRRLDLPRPPDMRFRPNGWLRVDDLATLERWGLRGGDSGPAHSIAANPGGQGRLDVAERLAVEQHAMKRAAEWCRDGGWPIVDDVSGGMSWDLEARKTRKGRPTFVEVKGTTGRHVDIELTINEVLHAQANPKTTALIVVTDIALLRGDPPTASGGTVNAFYPWSPKANELTPSRYRWQPAAPA